MLTELLDKINNLKKNCFVSLPIGINMYGIGYAQTAQRVNYGMHNINTTKITQYSDELKQRDTLSNVLSRFLGKF